MYSKAKVYGFHMEMFCDSKVQIIVPSSHGASVLCQCLGGICTEVLFFASLKTFSSI